MRLHYRTTTHHTEDTTMTTTITTEENYDETLAEAAELLAERVPDADEDDNQTPKWRADALNNEWVEGMTVRAWVDAAAARLGA